MSIQVDQALQTINSSFVRFRDGLAEVSIEVAEMKAGADDEVDVWMADVSVTIRTGSYPQKRSGSAKLCMWHTGREAASDWALATWPAITATMRTASGNA